METISEKEFNKNPELQKIVSPDSELKNILVEYVGNDLEPEDKNVTLEMIVEVVAKEFPEFVFALAEENWVRGYQQGLEDVELGMKLANLEKENNENKKDCKLCGEAK